MMLLLRRVINPAVQLQHSAKKLVFVEAEDTAKLKTIEFTLTKFVTEQGGQVKNAVIIDSDKDDSDKDDSNKDDGDKGDDNKPNVFAKFSHFFNDDCPDINRKCDYIICHQKGEDLRVMLFEMKSSEQGLDGRCPAQFAISKVFTDYLMNLAQTYAKLNCDVQFEALQVKYFNVAFYPGAPVAHATPVGVNPMVRSKKTVDGITSFTVNTTKTLTKVDWRFFMEAIDS